MPEHLRRMRKPQPEPSHLVHDRCRAHSMTFLAPVLQKTLTSFPQVLGLQMTRLLDPPQPQMRDQVDSVTGYAGVGLVLSRETLVFLRP